MYIFRNLAFSCSLVLLLSCGDDDKNIREGVHQSPDYSKNVSRTNENSSSLYVWPGGKYVGGLVPVCWEATNLPTVADRELTKRWIVDRFEQQLAVHFVGWEICNGDKYSSGVRIFTDDSNPRVTDIGNSDRGKISNMFLNYTFGQWGPSCNNSLSSREECVKSIAAHEFGHVLSALHEQARPDTPPACPAFLHSEDGNYLGEMQPATGTPYVYAPAGSAWDIKSMMNYCNTARYSYDGVDYASLYDLSYNNRGFLSQGDVAGFQTLYGGSKFASHATVAGPSPNWSFALDINRSNQKLNPDLLMVSGPNATGSGFVEVHVLSGVSSYKQWILHVATPIRVVSDTSYVYGWDFFDYDGDGKKDLVYFVNNGASRKLEIHIYSAASNFQTALLHAATVMPNSANYKFAFGDYDNNGSTDLFVIQKNGMNILDGSRGFQYILNNPYFDYTPTEFDECRFILGNFYNHARNAPDLVCMQMAKSSGANISAFALQWPNYNNKTKVTESLLQNEDGNYAGFASWKDGVNTDNASGASSLVSFPGKGMKVAYFRKWPVEVHYFDAQLIF